MRVNYFLPSVVREDVAPDLETGIRWLASAPRNPLGGYEWAGWTDDTTPRTDRPVRFVAHAARPDYRTFRGVSGLSSHIVRLPA